MSSEKEPSKSPKEMVEDAKPSIDKTFSSSKMFEESLRSAIRSGVKATNSALASMEQSTEQIRKPVVTAFQTVGREGRNLAQEATSLYTVRREYAPHIIGGSIVFGGLIGLRRGRIPAAVTGSLLGFFAYLGVYQVDLQKLPEHVFGRKDD